MNSVSNNNLPDQLPVSQNGGKKSQNKFDGKMLTRQSAAAKQIEDLTQTLSEYKQKFEGVEKINKTLMNLGNKHVGALYPGMMSGKLQQEQNPIQQEQNPIQQEQNPIQQEQNKNLKRKAVRSGSEPRRSLIDLGQKTDGFDLIKKLHTQKNNLETKNGELTKTNEGLTKTNKELTETNEGLTQTNKELTETNVTLAKTVINDEKMLQKIIEEQNKSKWLCKIF